MFVLTTHSKKLFTQTKFLACRKAATTPCRIKTVGPEPFRKLSKPDIEEIKGEVVKFDNHLEINKASTPPKSFYTDPRFFSYEKEKIFMRNWIYAGRKSQLSKPGSFITGDVMGEPYIITRDSDGKLAAFYNVCRHHASTLKEEDSGTCQEIVCPYHGWTYSLDGKLKKANSIKGIENFSAKDFGLKKIRLAELGPLLFIHLGTEPPRFDFSEFMECHKIMSERNYEEMHHVKRVEFIFRANWKIYVDNYIDGAYHVPYLHPGLNSQIDTDLYKFVPKPNWSLQSVPGLASQSDPFLKSRVGEKGAVYAFMYPTLGINRFGDWMDTNYLVPLSVDKTLVVFDWYYKEPKTAQNEAEIEKNIEAGNQIQLEDEIICERVQRGLYSNGFEYGRYAPTVEEGVRHFHSWVHKNYSEE